MKYKFILFVIGLLVFLMGALPLVSNIIPAASKLIGEMPKAGTITYQLILVLLGILSIGYALKRERLIERKR